MESTLHMLFKKREATLTPLNNLFASSITLLAVQMESLRKLILTNKSSTLLNPRKFPEITEVPPKTTEVPRNHGSSLDFNIFRIMYIFDSIWYNYWVLIILFDVEQTKIIKTTPVTTLYFKEYLKIFYRMREFNQVREMYMCISVHKVHDFMQGYLNNIGAISFRRLTSR